VKCTTPPATALTPRLHQELHQLVKEERKKKKGERGGGERSTPYDIFPPSAISLNNQKTKKKRGGEGEKAAWSARAG